MAPNKPGPKPRLYLFRGQQLTIPEICELTGETETRIRNRRCGDRVLEGKELEPPEWCWQPRRITFNGKTQTIPSWERETGLPVYSRISLGWTIERALTEPLRKQVAFRGVALTLSKWGQHRGIKSATIYRRIQLGWPMELAITQPAMKRGERLRMQERITYMVQAFQASKSTDAHTTEHTTPGGTSQLSPFPKGPAGGGVCTILEKKGGIPCL